MSLDKKITDPSLTLPATLDGTEVIYADQGGADVKVTTAQLRAYSQSNRVGQCRLVLDGTNNAPNLRLNPWNGNLLTINSKAETVPDAGVVFGVGSLISGTNYYIYAYMSGGVLTLEATTAGYAVQAGTGIMIKSGDATRSLVGFGRPNSTNWVDSAQVRTVRSWYNEPDIAMENVFTATRTLSAADSAWHELNTEIRLQFLSLTRDIWSFRANSSVYCGTAGDAMFMGISIDGAAPAPYCETMAPGVNYEASESTEIMGAIAEGFHYVTLAGFAASHVTNFINTNLCGNLVR